MMRNSSTSWGWVSRSLHWGMAVLIAIQVVLGKYSHDLDRSVEKLNLMMWHKSIGITLLFLVLIRLAWLVISRRPAPERPAPAWEKWLARISHVSLYALMIGIPISGWLMNSAKNVPFSLYRAVPWPALIAPDKVLGKIFEEWHEFLGNVLIVIVFIHVTAALWHHFHRKDSVLANMLGGGNI